MGATQKTPMTSTAFKSVVLPANITLPAAVKATKAIADITYTAASYGEDGNSITIEYTDGATAGSEVVTVSGTAITIQIEASVSTATQVKAAFDGAAAATALASATITGTASNAQAVTAATALASGAGNGSNLPRWITSLKPTSTDGQYSLILANKWAESICLFAQIHVDDASTSSVAAKMELMNADNFSADVLAGTALELHAIDFAGAEVVVNAASRLHLMLVVSDTQRN